MERTNLFPKERERTPLALAKEWEQEKMVRNHPDEQTRRRFFKVSVGIPGKQVINRTVKFSWKGK